MTGFVWYNLYTHKHELLYRYACTAFSVSGDVCCVLVYSASIITLLLYYDTYVLCNDNIGNIRFMRLPLREVVSGRRRVRFVGAARIRGVAGGGEETSDKEKKSENRLSSRRVSVVYQLI